ncbi:hypothetical protein C7999DRAFT_29350 [Corynascus novoguineensis]|uniref:Uncharacterized protein n=1 Tax=Corynascus novoguineensis TaxID=1126955 RepID=A0AAN7CXK1_9PEZI|nr:hypothetical protein C7999DRAFT_29350 [Corynascus novoguineensis]
MNLSTTSSSLYDDFTPEMRDRQARGKDPYQSGDGSDGGNLSDRESGSGTRLRLGSGRVEKEDFARIESRQKAIAFLESPELLMMYAQSTGDSIAAARLHFTKMLCGYDNEEESGRNITHPAFSHSRRDLYQASDNRRGVVNTRTSTN